METEFKDRLIGDKKIPFKTMLKRSKKYIKREVPSLIVSFALIIINVLIDLIFPLITGYFTDNLQSSNIVLSSLLFLALGYFILTIVNQVILYFESMTLQKAGQRIVYQLRMEVFTHIENMSQNQFNEMPVGSLVTRVANYTASMSDLFTSVLVNILRNVLTVVGVYCFMLYISPLLSLIMLGLLFIVFIVTFFFKRIIAKFFKEEKGYISDLNTFLNENLSGMKIIQLFNQQKRKDEEFSQKNENLRKSRFNITLAFAIYRPFIQLIYYCSIALTFYFGVVVLPDFGFIITAGNIVSFYLYLSRFFNPIQQLADQLNDIQKAISSCERLFNLLDVAPEVNDRADAIEVNTFKGKIEFKNVYFAYEKENWILKDVSFTVAPGQTVAFVGATGAGKTTILSLIVRNYEIQKGQILIDDIDITHIKIECLRKAIGQMLQDVFLFSGTIRSNITLHDDQYSDEEINEVCHYVNADSFIALQEKGLDEEVIERGENFSQGQRQLLSFARTVLHKPQILILDEATANIDTETEVLIQESLDKIKNIGTMLVVAHRLSTIQKADQIIVLNHGEIIEKGTHQELLKNRGYYYKLYQLQFANKH